MLKPPFSFDAIMAPLGAERFFAEYEGKQPLHLKGAADKFAEVMTWARLNDLLGQATIWSQQSLVLVLDKDPIPPARYCAPAPGRDGGQVLRPDPDKVKDFLRRGATLVANDIDHLSPGLTAFADAMEQALGGKVQGNLYLSSRRRQGFGAHFDTHDVYAVHVEGTKTWHVYEGRATDPIAHPMFKNLGREHHEKAKGAKLMDVHMEPGRSALSAARPVPRRARRRRRHRPRRVRHHLSDRHGRDELPVRAGRRRAGVSGKSATCGWPGRSAGVERSPRGLQRQDPRRSRRAQNRGADRVAAARLSLSAPRLCVARPAGRAGRRSVSRARRRHPHGAAERPLRPGPGRLARGHRSPGRGRTARALGARAVASSRAPSWRRRFRSAGAPSSTSCCATSAPCA